MGGTKLTTLDALSYLREVKNRFADRKEVYDTFLDIMKEFKVCKIDTSGVIDKVKRLFKGHNELILGFNTFLPKDNQIQLKDLEEPGQDRTAACDGEGPPVDFDTAINYVNKVKARFHSKMEEYKKFLDVLNAYRINKKSIDEVYDEVSELFAAHPDLKRDFMVFLPNPALANKAQWGSTKGKTPEPTPVAQDGRNLRHKNRKSRADRRDDDDEDMARGPGRPQLVKEMAFFDRVKQRLRNPDAYVDFIKCINLYNAEVITIQELMQLLGDIFNRHPDLMTGFQEFVAKCDHMEVDEAKIREQAELQRKKDEDRQRRKFLTKPLSTIVLGEKKRVTPSYVRMPANYPHLATSGRTPLADSVLNSELVNVITGSEDYSFKLMRKNQYEEALFRCEDDRYDFEMAIERNVAAMKRLKPVAERLAAMTDEERAKFKFDTKLLGPVHWRSIENMYGEQGPAIVEQIRKTPAVVIPVVVDRMGQKDMEWRRVRAEMTQVWKEIFEANYHKSLDHRSFYFKQAEKKALMPKTLVAEVREAADKRRQEQQKALPTMCRAMSQAHRHDLLSDWSKTDLSFDYSEKAVFGDIYRILRVALEENLTGISRLQVLELYLGLLEPFFGQEVRQAELEAVQAVLAEELEAAAAAAAAARTSAPASARGRGGRFGRGTRNSQQASQQVTAAGPRSADGGDASTLSEGSDQEGARSEPAATPELRLGDGKEGSAGGSDREVEDEEMTAADAGRGQGQDAAGTSAGASGAGRTQAGVSELRLDRAYAACKPLAAYKGSGSTAAMEVPAGLHLLFGNENMLHRILFDRLCTARKCVQSRCNADAAESLRQQQADAQRGGTVTPEPPQVLAAAFGKLHESFVAMLLDVIRGQIESSAFEDECRSALGTGSYELFTLDKLAVRIIKHMQLMVQDETTARLWALYKYERARGVPIHTTLYHVNCHAVLTDEPCYRIAYHPSSGALNVTLVEHDTKGPAPEAVICKAEGPVTDYIRSYVSEPTAPPPGDFKLIMRRNLPQPVRQSADVALVEALRSTAICNGLVCRVNCSTMKLAYLKHTEDVLFRTGTRRGDPDKHRERRRQRFTKWLHENDVMAQMERQQEEEESAADAAAAFLLETVRNRQAAGH
ncbi:hypothetical protein GPECTOR_1g719 [Gonium pectorale]|uniref:Histone deacetylase interacting domain-containing protein n=1 Tax=Gonium pectorale TaxID=33097 RepID=A0A150H4P2_GONPE|nr:hypothetical protein GPECTOR_1g719 [Gonium pectorale]|eukprot:KXZ56798.1 hypothetical protein GPECTOR_1g719 [Gonium pectorale]